jgi:Cu2+-containing amine oxidase
MTQNQIAYFNAQELKRHNMAAEVESQRHSRVQEAIDLARNRIQMYQASEQARSNLANEEIKRQQNAINAASAQESLRHNVVQEGLTKLQTASQNALNSALSNQAMANASLSGEKINTERSVQTSNYANAGFTTTQAINYPYSVNYTISQTDLNKARVIQTEQETKKTQVETVRSGVNTFWDSVNSAMEFLMPLKRVLVK